MNSPRRCNEAGEEKEGEFHDKDGASERVAPSVVVGVAVSSLRCTPFSPLVSCLPATRTPGTEEEKEEAAVVVAKDEGGAPSAGTAVDDGVEGRAASMEALDTEERVGEWHGATANTVVVETTVYSPPSLSSSPVVVVVVWQAAAPFVSSVPWPWCSPPSAFTEVEEGAKEESREDTTSASFSLPAPRVMTGIEVVVVATSTSDVAVGFPNTEVAATE